MALFDTSSRVNVSPTPEQSPVQRKKQDKMTFSDLLSDALDEPSTISQTPPSLSVQYSDSTSFFPPVKSGRIQRPPDTPGLLQGLHIHDAPVTSTEGPVIDDTMDWTPTTTPHRALKEFSPGQRANRPFGQAPTQPETSAFWYKVPPAPIPPAHKMRNPRPTILSPLPANAPSPPFSHKKRGKENSRPQQDAHGIDFKQPSFFAKEEDSDEANSLADLLGQSFSLGQGQDASRRSHAKSAWRSKGGLRPLGLSPQSPWVVSIILATVLSAWLLFSSVPVPYRTESQIVAVCVAGTIALRTTGDASDDVRPGVAAYVCSALGVMELATLCWVGWELWMGRGGVDAYGTGVLVVMLGHEAWNVLLTGTLQR